MIYMTLSYNWIPASAGMTVQLMDEIDKKIIPDAWTPKVVHDINEQDFFKIKTNQMKIVISFKKFNLHQNNMRKKPTN